MHGIDEDHCEESEYSKCEENEYCCYDASCIAVEYCSNKIDEQDRSEQFHRYRCNRKMYTLSQMSTNG